MMKSKKIPFTQEELNEYFNYNKLTGDLLRIKARKPQYVNTKCENYDKYGYNIVTLKGKRMKVHRLIMLFIYGDKFNQELAVDHIDGNPSNNKLVNLRQVSEKDNNRNCKLSSRNRSGVFGVNYYGKKWKVSIGDNNNNIHLGYYDDFFDAVCVRKSKELELNYYENHGR